MSTDKQIAQKLLDPAGITINGSHPYDIIVHNEKLYARVLSQGSLGLGEAYMDGWWDCQALDEFFSRTLAAKVGEKLLFTWPVIKTYLHAKIRNLQSRSGSQKVAKDHYDLPAELYMSFLDPYNQYTCGYFKDTSDLNVAQEQKLRLICEKLQLKKYDRVLDIGCGWGGFAKFAAEHYGCQVTGITISKEQAAYARTFTAGLPVTIRELDYRDLDGEYDKVLVCGMIEHVGVKNYRTIFQTIHDHLSVNGLFLLHTIGYKKSGSTEDPWVHKYIFANSMLPSVPQIGVAAERLFILEDLHNFGAYYDSTLMAWSKNFEHSWPQLKQTYDQRFYRMWQYYLLSFAGMFRARDAQLWQFVFSKNGIRGGYQSIR